MTLLTELYHRNKILSLFGSISLLGVGICALLILTTNTNVLGLNAWVKPMKFFASTVIFCWSMSWYMSSLNQKMVVSIFSWTVVITLGFELIWISFKAYNGELSHFNISSVLNGVMFGMMGLAITIMTLFTAYIGLLFFTGSFPNLPASYVWGIRLGILFFVVFAFEGFLMSSNMGHTIGAPDGGKGLRILNWSVTNGDLRVAHFVGMHSLQVLPIAGYYFLKTGKAIVGFSVLYLAIAALILVQSLMGIPLIRQ